MSSPEQVWLMRGFDRPASTQEELDDLWLPHLEVVERSPDLRGDDYDAWVDESGELLKSEPEGVRRSIIAESGSGKAALSVFARNPSRINRVVLLNTKIDEYDPESEWWQGHANLKRSSEVLPADLRNITRAMRYRTLNLNSRTDGTVKPHEAILAGAFVCIMNSVDGHSRGIIEAQSTHIDVISGFLLSGRAPSSV